MLNKQTNCCWWRIYDQLLDSTINNHVFPSDESNPDAAYQLVSDELILDGNSRQNLWLFVTCGWQYP